MKHLDTWDLTVRALAALDQLRRDNPLEFSKIAPNDAIKLAEKAQARGRRTIHFNPRRRATPHA